MTDVTFIDLNGDEYQDVKRQSIAEHLGKWHGPLVLADLATYDDAELVAAHGIFHRSPSHMNEITEAGAGHEHTDEADAKENSFVPLEMPPGWFISEDDDSGDE